MTTFTKPVKRIELTHSGNVWFRFPSAVIERKGQVAVLREDGQICCIASESAVIQQLGKEKKAKFIKQGQDISRLSCKWELITEVKTELETQRKDLVAKGYGSLEIELGYSIKYLTDWQ